MIGPRSARGTLVLVLLAALALAAPGAASAHKRKPSPVYYLALGDSLSQGIQPTATSQGVETKVGYVNDLYAAVKKRIPGLQLVDVGCPGDTTGSLLTGQGNGTLAKYYKCDRKGGSQLKAAVSFLKAHHKKGEVALITLDIGANDVDGCTAASNVVACVLAGVASIKTNTPKILSALHKAAPKGTTFAAMNLYDPVLSGFLESPYSAAYALAKESVSLLQGINTTIGAADSAAGFKTADVADAFDTYDATDTMTYNGVQVPKDVYEVCTLTWACAAPPYGPNIHANTQGYRVIAGAFEAVLGKL
jgi:lysophospholipase L1-like esterase